MKKPMVIFVGAAVLYASTTSWAQASGGDAVDLLVEAHDLLEHADQGAMVRALELLAAAQGRVFTVGGGLADLGYDALYGDVYALFAKGQGTNEARLRFDALPAPMRGDARGWVKAEVPALPERAFPMTFNGGEPAIVYVLASRKVPVTLRVTNAKGRALCKASSQKGRALCRWQPAQKSAVQVRVTSKAFREQDTIAIYTN